MARKLKTYVTAIGFFEEAIAAPSMKAALEAWGSNHNLFHQGLAKEVSDPAIIAATMKQPGISLKRPVGSNGVFKTRAELPKALIDDQSKKAAVKTYPAKTNKKPTDRERKAAEVYKQKEKLRQQQRQKEQARRQKLIEKREASRIKAEQAFKKSEAVHNKKMQTLVNQQTAIKEKIETEEARWGNERERLEESVNKYSE